MRLAVMLAISIAALFAVEPGEPSRTAVLTLLMRAIGATIPDPEVRNPDHLAIKFLGPAERRIVSEFQTSEVADFQFATVWNQMRERGRRLFLHVLARTRVIDDVIDQGLRDGGTQVVILGAGYDSRAYRLKDRLAGATVFEVDLASTQALKRARLREVVDRVPDNVFFVPIDFEKEDLSSVLRRAGYRSNEKTVFVWEGVSMYLQPPAIDRTLRFVAHNSAPGSTIVFDYESDRAINGSHDDPVVAESMAWVAKLGEPHVFGLPIGRAGTFLEQRGLTLVDDYTPEELTRRYLTRKDGSKLGEQPWHYAVCVGRVPPRTARQH